MPKQAVCSQRRSSCSQRLILDVSVPLALCSRDAGDSNGAARSPAENLSALCPHLCGVAHPGAALRIQFVHAVPAGRARPDWRWVVFNLLDWLLYAGLTPLVLVPAAGFRYSGPDFLGPSRYILRAR